MVLSYDVVVVGGGVVGCSVLRSVTLAGYQACLVEAEADLLTHASGSNSGIICTGVDSPMGSLERALIRDSISQIRPYCQKHGIPFRPCGSLVCIWNEEQEEELQHVFQAGDTQARRLDAAQVRQLEPHLHPSCCGAVHIPGEMVVDPWLLAISYAVHARENGATTFTQFELDARAARWDGKVWTLVRKETSPTTTDHLDQLNLTTVSTKEAFDDKSNLSQPLLSLKARVVINAAGVWADITQAKAGAITSNTETIDQPPLLPQPTWKTQPRRGQYRIYSPSTNNTKTSFLTHPIQPVPTQFTKGIFVFSTLYDQIVIGPTAKEQVSRTDRSVDESVADELDQYAPQTLPSLATTGHRVVGDYVGIRPASTERDYQVHVYHRSSWITVAGIRSTGLTASLGIGRHVLHLLQSMLPPSQRTVSIRTTPLPPVVDLVQNYRERQDGKVAIFGYDYKVTHPITWFGWDAGLGIARI